MILSQFHIFPADGKTLFLDLVYFLATPLYKPFACPFFHVQNKCSTNKCCLCSLWFLRTRVNVPRHKAAQVWRRRGCAHKNLTPHGKSQGRSIFYKPLSASPYFALSHCMFFPICMAMGFCTCSKRSVTKPNENLLDF